MQITWKQHRESEDKKRRGGVNIGEVCKCGYTQAWVKWRTEDAEEERRAVSTGPRTDHSNYTTNNYIILISCGWTGEFDGLNTRFQKVCRDRRRVVGTASENCPGKFWSPKPVLFYVWLESEKLGFIHCLMSSSSASFSYAVCITMDRIRLYI